MHTPIQRQLAARRWLQNYADRIRGNAAGSLTVEAAASTQRDAAIRALNVICLTETTSDYLAEHDPQALKQSQIALNGQSWEDYIK